MSDEAYFNFKARKRVLRNFLDWIKNDIPHGAKVLDAGCGYGYLLNLCESYGWEPYGIDISKYAINRAKKYTKASLSCQDIEKTSFKHEFFNAVLLFDVIEHLKSPFNTLKEARRILKNDGVLAIHAPNVNALGRHFDTLLHREWFGVKDNTHIYLFTPFSLKILVNRSGFETIKVETPFKPFPKPLSLGRSGLGGAIWLMARKK